jgi:hypothetical protein
MRHQNISFVLYTCYMRALVTLVYVSAGAAPLSLKVRSPFTSAVSGIFILRRERPSVSLLAVNSDREFLFTRGLIKTETVLTREGSASRITRTHVEFPRGVLAEKTGARNDRPRVISPQFTPVEVIHANRTHTQGCNG